MLADWEDAPTAYTDPLGACAHGSSRRHRRTVSRTLDASSRGTPAATQRVSVIRSTASNARANDSAEKPRSFRPASSSRRASEYRACSATTSRKSRGSPRPHSASILSAAMSSGWSTGPTSSWTAGRRRPPSANTSTTTCSLDQLSMTTNRLACGGRSAVVTRSPSASAARRNAFATRTASSALRSQRSVRGAAEVAPMPPAWRRRSSAAMRGATMRAGIARPSAVPARDRR